MDCLDRKIYQYLLSPLAEGSGLKYHPLFEHRMTTVSPRRGEWIEMSVLQYTGDLNESPLAEGSGLKYLSTTFTNMGSSLPSQRGVD